MGMRRIDIEEARVLARRKGLRPGRVKGSASVQFTKGRSARLEVIGWDEFEAALARRGLAIFESGGWLKLMKKS